jgi:GNAT superfamily N-acetyltransferase
MRMTIDESRIEMRRTKVFFLRMERPFPDPVGSRHDVSIELLPKPISPDVYKKYYAAVGARHHWIDRLVILTDELNRIINQPKVHIYIMKVAGANAGYLELVKEEHYVELLYFGLFPDFIGKGLGSYFLQWSVNRAAAFEPKWIQLNTCELDHPNALPTYRKLGFVDYKSSFEDRRVLLRP